MHGWCPADKKIIITKKLEEITTFKESEKKKKNSYTTHKAVIRNQPCF